MYLHRPARTRRSFAVVLALALILPLTLTLSGCTEKYTQSDIEDYVRKELGIKEFTVAPEPVVKKDHDGNSDKYWTVTTDWYGLDKPLTFDVVDDHVSGLFGPVNGLNGDASEAIYEAIGRMYHPSGKLTQVQVENLGQQTFVWRYPIFSRADFEGAWPEIQDFQAFLKKYPRISDISFAIGYHPESADEAEQRADAFLRENYIVYIKAGFTHDDFLNALNTPNKKDHQDVSPVDFYLEHCLKLGLRSRIAEFSDEEIAKVLQQVQYLVPVRDENEKVLNPTVVYNYDAIAYGHLFELARGAGLQVEGTWAQFVVQGADGEAHSFFYEKKDEYDLPQVSQELAGQILGFKLDTSEEWVDRTITAETFVYVRVRPQELVEHLEANSDGQKVTTKIVDGDLRIHAKKNVLSSVVRAYEDEANKLQEQVRQTSGSHFAWILERDDYAEGIDLRVYSKKDLTGSNAARLEKIAKLAYLNRQLLNPSDEPFPVSVQKVVENWDGWDYEELATFNVPEDKLDFSNIWH